MVKILKSFLFLIVMTWPMFFNEIKGDSTQNYQTQVKSFSNAIKAYERKQWNQAKMAIEEIRGPLFHAPNYFYFYKSKIFLEWAKQEEQYPIIKRYLILSYDNLKMISEGVDIDSFSKKVFSLKIEILENIIFYGFKYHDFLNVINSTEELAFFRDLKDQEILQYVEGLIRRNLITKGRQVLRRYQTLLEGNIASLSIPLKKQLQIIQLEKEKLKLKEMAPLNSPPPEKFIVTDYEVEILKLLNQKFLKSDEIDTLINALKLISYSEKSRDIQKKILKKYESFFMSADNESGDGNTFIEKIEDHFILFSPGVMIETLNFHWHRYDFKKAEKIGLSILKNFPRDMEIPKVLFYLGRMAQDAKEYQNASDYFQQLIETGFGTQFYEWGWFQKAWSSYLAGEDGPALKGFADYLQRYPEGEHAQASRYFSIKILKRTEGADPILIKNWEEQLLSYGKIEFYSIIYLYNNQREYPFYEAFKLGSKSQAVYKDQIQTSVVSQGKLKKIEELVRFGLYQDAKEILNSIPPTRDSFPLLVTYAELLKDEGLSIMAKCHTRFAYEMGIHPQMTSLRWVFPLRWMREIEESLKKLNWDVSPYLIISLIRQESVFDSTAISSSNAKGPMQLIDSTAKMMAESLNLKSFDLFDFKDNLLLGISNLKTEWTKFDQNIYLTLAAYNAGPTATSRWQKIRGDLKPLEFIESIPYKETRTYVKTILRNYFFYQMIYQNKSLKETTPLIQNLE